MSGAGGPAGAGGPVPLLVSLLAAAAVSSATLHLAARYVLGDVPFRRAALAGPVVPLVVFVLLGTHPAAVLAASLAADVAAVSAVYRLRYRTAGLVAAVHYAVSLLLGVVLANLVQLLSAPPA